MYHHRGVHEPVGREGLAQVAVTPLVHVRVIDVGDSTNATHAEAATHQVAGDLLSEVARAPVTTATGAAGGRAVRADLALRVARRTASPISSWTLSPSADVPGEGGTPPDSHRLIESPRISARPG